MWQKKFHVEYDTTVWPYDLPSNATVKESSLLQAHVYVASQRDSIKITGENDRFVTTFHLADANCTLTFAEMVRFAQAVAESVFPGEYWQEIHDLAMPDQAGNTRKILAIKRVREIIPSMGLKDARDFVNSGYFD